MKTGHLRDSKESNRRIALTRVLMVAGLMASCAYSQTAQDAAKELEKLRGSAGHLTEEQAKRVDAMFKDTSNWTAADRANAFNNLIDLVGGQQELFGIMGYVSDFTTAILKAVGEIDEHQYQEYFKKGQEIVKGSSFGNWFSKPASKPEWEIRYLIEEHLKRMSAQAVDKVYHLNAGVTQNNDRSKYSYTLSNDGSKPICDFVLTFSRPDGKHTDTSKAKDMIKDEDQNKGTVAPDGWQRVFLDGGGHLDELRFETNDPAKCISKGGNLVFAFETDKKNFFLNGRAFSSVSTLVDGEHKTISAMNYGILGPMLVEAPKHGSTENGVITMTGTVIEGQPATLSVHDPSGAALEGVVLDVGGHSYVTNALGLVTVIAPAGAGILTARLNPVSSASARVLPAQGSSVAPSVTTANAYVPAGSQFTIGGTGFSGAASRNQVLIGNRPLDVLASSPNEIVAKVPDSTPLGSQNLTVKTDRGSSPNRALSVVHLQIEGNSRTLHRGQKAEAQLIVLGTRDRVTVSLTNQSPSVIRLSGGDSVITARTTGGDTNRVKVDYTAIGPGAFQVQSRIVEPGTGR